MLKYRNLRTNKVKNIKVKKLKESNIKIQGLIKLRYENSWSIRIKIKKFKNELCC